MQKSKCTMFMHGAHIGRLTVAPRTIYTLTAEESQNNLLSIVSENAGSVKRYSAVLNLI